MQSSWWADFRATIGFEHFAAILKDRDGIVGGALVQKFSHASETCFYYLQDGPVLPSDESIAGEVFETLLEALEDHRNTETQTGQSSSHRTAMAAPDGFRVRIPTCPQGSLQGAEEHPLY